MFGGNLSEEEKSAVFIFKHHDDMSRMFKENKANPGDNGNEGNASKTEDQKETLQPNEVSSIQE